MLNRKFGMKDHTTKVFNEALSLVQTIQHIEPWKPSLYFTNVTIVDKTTNMNHFKPTKTDLLSLDTRDGDIRIHFDKTRYKTKDDLDSLVTDLKTACTYSGFHLNRNGGYYQKINPNLYTRVIRLCCSHCINSTYKGSKQAGVDPRTELEGRKRTLIGDRRNNRNEGRKLPRQTSTLHAHDVCTFAFEVFYDGEGFVFQAPKGIKSYHQGHKKLEVHEMTLRKSEVTDRMRDRMIEDAGVAMSVAGTQRVLNMIIGHNGPFIRHNMVRTYRASHILRSSLDGTIVDRTGKNEIDEVLELLSSNQARVTYLSVKPILNTSGERKNVFLSSKPSDLNLPTEGTYLVRCKETKLDISVCGVSDQFLQVTKIKKESPLYGLVSVGDRILSINGKSLSRCTLDEFSDCVRSLSMEQKLLKMQHKKFTSSKTSLNESVEEKELCHDLRYSNGYGKIFTKEMSEELERIAMTYRKDTMDADTEVELFLSLAWICPFSHNIANMHANCVMVDTTFNVCRFTNYRQFSVCVKSTNGKVYTVARIGVPHEKSALLAWVIECCIPSLLTELFPLRVNCFISDGDPYLCQAIDNSLRSVYRSAIRLRCGYHICTRSWINNIDGSLKFHEFVPEDIKDSFMKLILNWIYSWMRPSITSEAEFELSRDLLFAWLTSKEVIENVCSLENASMIVMWVKESILPYRNQFLFYKRKTIFNMDNYTTCPVEGTHRAIKGNAFGVSRSDTLPVYVKKAIDYDTMKAKELQSKVCSDQHKTYLFGEPWMNQLNERGAKLTYNMIQHSERYASQFLECIEGMPSFVVLCDVAHDEDVVLLGEDPMKRNEEQSRKASEKSYAYEVPSCHPKFRHAWRVILQKTHNDEYYLVCSCMLYKRCGLPCTHCIHIFHYHLKPFSLFEDIDFHCFKVHWWKVTEYLVHKKPGTLTAEEKDLFDKLLELSMDNEKVGVCVRLRAKITNGTILKVEWNKTLVVGSKVTTEETLDPVSVAQMSPQERLLGWKVMSVGDVSVDGMVPAQTVIDYIGNQKEDEDIQPVTTVRKQEECRKDLLQMLYGICEKVHLPTNDVFYSNLKRSLEDFHTEAVTIAMSNMANEREGLVQRSFAGVVGHNKETNIRRMHGFSSPKRRRKKNRESRLNTMNSP